MKQLSLVKVSLGLIFIILVTMGMKKIFPPEKKYTVSKTKDGWMTALRYIENAKFIMAKSELPASQVSAWSDSLSQLEQSIQMEVMLQINADSVKTKK